MKIHIHTEWNGIISSGLYKEEYVKIYHKIGDYAKNFEWDNLLNEISANGTRLVNSVELNEKSFNTPLHQATLGGAPLEVVQKLIEFGAWRSIVNADNEIPLDIALKTQRKYLYKILKPSFWFNFHSIDIQKIEINFHKVILDRISVLSIKDDLRLPKLSVLFENQTSNFWFPVPGMYGGFNYWWDLTHNYLVSESWSRIIGGSGQRHIIKVDEIILSEEGFA